MRSNKNSIFDRLLAASRRPRGEPGQATVEFSLVVVLLLLLMFSIVDFGRMVAIHTATVTASREAARYGAAVGIDLSSGYAQYVDCVGIRNAAREVVGGLVTIPDGDIVISWDRYNEGAGRFDPVPAAACGDETKIDRLDRIVVQVTVTYRPITPMLQVLVQPVTVVSMDARTIVKADP